MPPKQKVPAPIDRPLSRAYLREFSGWSTAYPPGLSDPTSLRTMENVLINRDGSARIRPGLRNLTYMKTMTDHVLWQDMPICGSFEPFYLNNGKKAYLFACRSDTLGVFFRVGIVDPATHKVLVTDLTDGEVNFDIDYLGGPPGIGPVFTTGTTYVKYVQIDNKILALSNNGEPFITFHVGATKRIPNVQEITWPVWQPQRVGYTPLANVSALIPDRDWINGPQTSFNFSSDFGTAYQDDSLHSSDPNHNVFNIVFYYTMSNELGETEPSSVGNQITIKRALGNWSWGAPKSTGDAWMAQEPDPNNLALAGSKCADQFIVGPDNSLNAGEFLTAVAQGATHLNIYVASWSNQDSVPTEIVLIGQRKFPDSGTITMAEHGWVSINPSSQPLGRTLPFPTQDNVKNTTAPARAGQGLVAADRLVLVYDPTAAAVIRWTTNEQGNYLNFAANAGGGYKTLTSGNMQVPAVAKLWQNPQSADTITVMCMGTDAASSAYYMAPASVSSQSDNTQIMGFEETTATPGTVSPYGCEVANNALYHPLDDQLMKSTASNYNITHKAMTDQIVNKWVGLENKHKIVSCFFDQRLYYLVHNPDGAPLEQHCLGNEVWVFDLAAENGNWSRWLTQGCSLKKTQSAGRVYLSLIRPNGIFIFDEEYRVDDHIHVIYPGESYGELQQRAIPWQLETNTQGANRAHDAWSHLQQVSITLGNFTGAMEYGVRGHNRHGQMVEKRKIVRDSNPPGDLPWDLEDIVLVKHDLKEWRLFAGSIVQDGEVQQSAGQINLVQYRYTPISVNVGYEHGSVETFVYGRDSLMFETGNTTNATPMPMVDTSRP